MSAVRDVAPAVPALRSSRTVRVACVAAEPVFYQAPLYRRLGSDPRIDLTVLFASEGGVRPYDAGFGAEPVVWDDDLLSGYRSEFLRSAATNHAGDGFLALRDSDVFRRVRRGRFDAVWLHGYSYATLWLAAVAARASGAALLVREEQTLLHERAVPKRWARGLVLRSLFGRSFGLYIGSQNRRFFEHYGVASDRFFHVPYCVDNERLREEAVRLRPRRTAIRSAFGLGRGPTILFVGKLVPKKQPELLLEAFRRLRNRRECSLLFVGAGPMEAMLRETVERERIPDVVFAGFRNRAEIAEAFVAADVLALPSARHETWGIVVNEALNFELPVVVSDKVGAGYDLVRNAATGYVFRHDDVDALTHALAALVESPELRSAFGQRGLRLVDAFSYDRARDGVVEAALAASGRTP